MAKTKEPVVDSGTPLVISQSVLREQGSPFCVGLMLFGLSYLCLVGSAAGYKLNCPVGSMKLSMIFEGTPHKHRLTQLVGVCCLDQFQELKFQITVAGECYSSLVGDGKRK